MLISMRQTRIGNALRNHLRKPAALALLGAHVKLLALIDIEEKGGRLGLIQFLVAGARSHRAGRAVGLAVAQELDPAILLLLPLRGSVASNCHVSQKWLDQRLDRLGPGLAA